MTEQYLLLKFGTWKGFNITGNAPAKAAMDRYFVASFSGMAQPDTQAQKKELCDVIDALPDDAEISNDWSGEKYTKDAAKRYVMEYPR